VIEIIELHQHMFDTELILPSVASMAIPKEPAIVEVTVLMDWS
jgi:hypothetical protein